MTPRHWLMGAVLAVAAWLAIFGDKNPGADVVEPVPRASGNARPSPVVSQTETTVANKPRHALTILALLPREQLIGGAHADAAPLALFSSRSWTPPPPPPAPPPPPPPPPTAPPVPFTVLGKKLEDGIWEVYLAKGENTYIVRDQTVLAGIYRVDSIKPPQLVLTYLPLNQTQTLTIGGSD